MASAAAAARLLLLLAAASLFAGTPGAADVFSRFGDAAVPCECDDPSAQPSLENRCGYELVVDGMHLCVRRPYPEFRRGDDPTQRMTSQWVANVSCVGQVVFEVTNLGRQNSVPIEGVAQQMLVMIEGGSYLSVPDSYGYKTEAEEGATGAVAFTAWGGQAAPNQTFSLAFTLACDKVWDDGGPTWPGDPFNCPCPVGAIPDYFRLPGTAHPFQPDDPITGPVGGAWLQSVSNFDASATMLAIDGETATLVTYPRAPILFGVGVAPEHTDTAWEREGKCYRKTWFAIANAGKSVIEGGFAGPWHVALPALHTLHDLGEQANFDTAASPGFQDFDIWNIGFYMAPAGSANPEYISYFAIATVCGASCGAPECALVSTDGRPDVVFTGVTVEDYLAGPNVPYYTLASGPDSLENPIVSALIQTQVEGTVNAVCTMPYDDTLFITWPVNPLGGKLLYSANQRLTGYDATADWSPRYTVESFVFSETARVRVDGLAERPRYVQAGAYNNVTWLIDTPPDVIPTAMLVPFITPPLCSYFMGDFGSAVDDNPAMDPVVGPPVVGLPCGAPFDMTEPAVPRRGGGGGALGELDLSWRLQSLQLRAGSCYPGQDLTADPYPCSSMHACLKDPLTEQVVCQLFGGQNVASESAAAFMPAVFDVDHVPEGYPADEQPVPRMHEHITEITVYQNPTEGRGNIVGVVINSQQAADESGRAAGSADPFVSEFVKTVTVLGVTTESATTIMPPIMSSMKPEWNNVALSGLVGWFKGSATSGTYGSLCSLEPVWLAPHMWVPTEPGSTELPADSPPTTPTDGPAPIGPSTYQPLPGVAVAEINAVSEVGEMATYSPSSVQLQSGNSYRMSFTYAAAYAANGAMVHVEFGHPVASIILEDLGDQIKLRVAGQYSPNVAQPLDAANYASDPPPGSLASAAAGGLVEGSTYIVQFDFRADGTLEGWLLGSSGNLLLGPTPMATIGTSDMSPTLKARSVSVASVQYKAMS